MMKRTAASLLWLSLTAMCTAACLAPIDDTESVTHSEDELQSAHARPLTAAVKPVKDCCDPADEPGTNGNPLCFEGASCCADGSWACNNGDGSSSCDATGQACSPAPYKVKKKLVKPVPIQP